MDTHRPFTKIRGHSRSFALKAPPSSKSLRTNTPSGPSRRSAADKTRRQTDHETGRNEASQINLRLSSSDCPTVSLSSHPPPLWQSPCLPISLSHCLIVSAPLSPFTLTTPLHPLPSRRFRAWRGSKVVMHWSAKPVCAGSIPALASIHLQSINYVISEAQKLAW